MFDQMTLTGLISATSSQASRDGRLHCASPGSTRPQESGPEAPPVRTTVLQPPSTAGGLASRESAVDLPTNGLISSRSRGRKGSSSRTSQASTRGLPRSPIVWDELAIECADPNDRLRMLVHLIYAGECGLLPTVVARDFRSPGDPLHPRRSATRGQPLPETFSSPVPAELARWMMGFPPEWAQCMPTATP